MAGGKILEAVHHRIVATEAQAAFGFGVEGPSQVVPVVKNLPAEARDVRGSGLIPGSGRSPGGGNGNPLQYSCLGNPMDRGGWRGTVHGVAKEPDTVIKQQ